MLGRKERKSKRNARGDDDEGTAKGERHTIQARHPIPNLVKIGINNYSVRRRGRGRSRGRSRRRGTSGRRRFGAGSGRLPQGAWDEHFDGAALGGGQRGGTAGTELGVFLLVYPEAEGVPVVHGSVRWAL